MSLFTTEDKSIEARHPEPTKVTFNGDCARSVNEAKMRAAYNVVCLGIALRIYWKPLFPQSAT